MPAAPSKSSVTKSPGFGPVATSIGAAPKSTTVVLAAPLSVPPPELTSTCSPVAPIVRPSIPTKCTLPTLAVRAVQVRRSVGVKPAAGALALRSARPNSTPVSSSPIAPSLPAGPLTPAKAFTPVAPTVRRSTCTVEGVVPSVTVTEAVSDFSKAKLPSRNTKPRTARSTVPAARSRLPWAPSKSMTSVLPPPVFTVRGAAAKSTTVVFASAPFRPLPRLTSRWKSLTATVRPSTPTTRASPMLARSASHFRRSVGGVSTSGSMTGLIMAIPNST